MLKNIVLEASEIWKTYGKPVLCGVSLKVMEGDFVAVLGPPAAGKSTLLRIMGFRESPDQGSVFFEGRLVGGGCIIEHESADWQERKVLLLTGDNRPRKEVIADIPGAAAVLLDEPRKLWGKRAASALQQVRQWNRSGIAVLMVTREPLLAAEAGIIYKLSGGQLRKISGTIL